MGKEKWGNRQRKYAYARKEVERPSATAIGNKEKNMREKTIEQKFTKAVKAVGGIPLKVTAANYDGMPDRIVLLPHGLLAFVELKAPGKKLRPLQEKRKRQLEGLGFLVFCIDNTEQIGGILDEIQRT